MGVDETSPSWNLVPTTQLELRGRGVGVDEDRAVLTAELVDGGERPPDTLLARRGPPAIGVLGAINARLVADRAAEEVERFQVTLARQEEASSTVVPDRPRGLRPVAALDLGEIVVAQQELDSLARSARGVAGEAWDAGEVGRLVEGEQQPWREHST